MLFSNSVISISINSKFYGSCRLYRANSPFQGDIKKRIAHLEILEKSATYTRTARLTSRALKMLTGNQPNQQTKNSIKKGRISITKRRLILLHCCHVLDLQSTGGMHVLLRKWNADYARKRDNTLLEIVYRNNRKQ